MNLLQNIQSILGQKSGSDAASNLLAPAALGGLLGALLTTETGRKIGGGALIVGGGAALGAVLWNKYKDQLKGAYGNVSNKLGSASAGDREAAGRERAERLIRAVVFAVKCDGHVDDKERQALQAKVASLAIGAEAERIVSKAMEAPLDPNSIADGVSSEEEALELYLVSCAAIDIDHFMERSYLDALALALKLPEEVKKGIEAQARGVAGS